MKILKTFILVTICLFCSLSASAYDFKVGDIYYTIISNTDFTVAVTYGDSKYSGKITIPETITYNEKTYSVTSIGNQAFRDCYVTSVTIPNSVTSIGNQAFSGCRHLFSITIPESVTSIGYAAFFDCWRLTSVTIPNSVTYIQNHAFSECTSLTSVTIGNSVTSIDMNAFSRCPSLTSIKVESGNPILDSRDNCNAIIKTSTNKLIIGCKETIIPNSVTSIGEYAFSSCSGLTSVTIPNSVTSIEQRAFEGCSSLTSVTIPNSVTTIEDGAFWACI